MSSSELSPAARAALEGFRAVTELRHGPVLAGALRALANHQRQPWNPETSASLDHWMPGDHTRRELLNIARELEAMP